MRFVIAFLVLAAGGFFYWQQLNGDAAPQAQAQRSAVPVTVATVGRQPFRDRIPALGTLQAWESIDITSPVSQIIESLNFDLFKTHRMFVSSMDMSRGIILL